ncbi:unnamed protein product, partial [Didymodactylos carnosus]
IYSSLVSTGTIIGIVIGCLAGAAVLIGIIITIVCICKKKNRVQIPQQQQQQQQQQQGMSFAYPGQYPQQPGQYYMGSSPYTQPGNQPPPQYSAQPTKLP